MEEKKYPLVVDLDGTLISTDILMEQTFKLIKDKPFYFFFVIFWLFKSYAYLKNEVSKRVVLNISLLPFKFNVLNYVKEQKKTGRTIILATAAQFEVAQSIASYLNLFDEVLATTPDLNLRGNNKRKVLNEKFGEKGYDYVGDAYIDLNVWKSARKAILIEPTKDLVARAQKISEIEKIFYPSNNKFRTLIKSIRISQWVKNLLLFVPILLSHTLNPSGYLITLFGFVLFNFLSSAVYLLNDLNDLESDREHPLKKKRPLASGEMHLSTGLYLSIFLIILSFALSSLLLNYQFTLILLAYLFSNILYTLSLKTKPIIDIITLSILYTLRLIAGGILSDVVLSDWFISFSIFFFTSLAVLKRYTELKLFSTASLNLSNKRGYTFEDINFLLFSGLSLSFISTLIFLLYTQSEKVYKMYSNPKYLIFIAPILLFFNMRTWYKATKITNTDNPIEIILKDKINYILFLLTLLILIIAI
jgi:4-hydroxybenzoate polyprenyltransferase/phosphoserine phosphatase